VGNEYGAEVYGSMKGRMVAYNCEARSRLYRQLASTVEIIKNKYTEVAMKKVDLTIFSLLLACSQSILK
jgi:hypothetical protein